MSPQQRERRRRRRHPPMTEIAIYTDIDSVTGFGPQMLRDGLAEAAGGPVSIRLNSQGGNVIDGLACHNLLQAYPGEVTVVIDGMALSIASLIACGGDKVQMAENAWFMIHNPHNDVSGDGDGLRDMAALLDGMRDQLATVYSAKSKKPREEILQLMAAETWLTGPQAKESGFVDEVIASLEVAAEFDASRFSRPPQTKTKETAAMASATYHELKTAFPRAKAEFLTKCLDKDLTIDKARAEYDEAMAKAMEEKDAELAKAAAEIEEMKKESEAKAKAEEEEKKEAEASAKAKAEEEKKAAEAKAKSGVLPVGDGKARGGQSATAEWNETIADKMKAGLPKSKAIRSVVIERPELHQSYLAEVNAHA